MSRSKEQFINETGGFRLTESQGEFQARQDEIQFIKRAIAKGQATDQEVKRLAFLIGTDNEVAFEDEN